MWLKGGTLKRLAFGDQKKDTVRMEVGQDRQTPMLGLQGRHYQRNEVVARRNLLIKKPFLLHPNIPGRATKQTHIRDKHTTNSLYSVASGVHAELLVRGQEGDLREWGGIPKQKGRCVYNNSMSGTVCQVCI